MQYFDHRPASGDIPECFVCLLEPEWSRGVRHTYTLASALTEGTTGVEIGIPDQQSLRLRVEYDFVLEEAEATELRQWLGTLGTIRLAVPLWVDDVDLPWLHAPQKVISWNDAGEYVITGPAESYAYAYAAPLLVGKLDKRPKVQPLGRGLCAVSIAVVESAPWSCRIDPSAEFDLLTEFTLEPNWVKKLSELTRDQVEDLEFRQAREIGQFGPSSITRWGQEGGFTLDRSEAGQLLRFFLDRLGRVRSFPCETWFQPGTAVPTAPHAATFRFERESLTLDFDTPDCAETTLQLWQQVELDEGEPPQHAAPRANLYEFTWEGESPIRFTSWEAPLVCDGVDYTPALVGHENLRLSTSSIGDECEVAIFARQAGNPLAEIAAGEIDRELAVRVMRCDPTAAAPVSTPIFAGTVRKVTLKGGRHVATCAVLGGRFRRPIPKHVIQKGCNYCLFDRGCGLAKAAHARTGSFTAALPGSELAFTPTAAPGGAYANEWFAGGWVECTGSDGRYYRRPVNNCSVSGGVWTLRLGRPLPAVCASQPLVAYPGCDGRYSVCKGKFGNGAAFGGFPFTPMFISTSAGNAQKTSVK